MDKSEIFIIEMECEPIACGIAKLKKDINLSTIGTVSRSVRSILNYYKESNITEFYNDVAIARGSDKIYKLGVDISIDKSTVIFKNKLIVKGMDNKLWNSGENILEYADETSLAKSIATELINFLHSIPTPE